MLIYFTIQITYVLSFLTLWLVSQGTSKRLTFDGAKALLGKETGTIYPTGE